MIKKLLENISNGYLSKNIKRSIDNLIKLVKEHDLHPIVDSKFSYQDAAKAHRYIQDRKNFGKVLLDFTSV